MLGRAETMEKELYSATCAVCTSLLVHVLAVTLESMDSPDSGRVEKGESVHIRPEQGLWLIPEDSDVA